MGLFEGCGPNESNSKELAAPDVFVIDSLTDPAPFFPPPPPLKKCPDLSGVYEKLAGMCGFRVEKGDFAYSCIYDSTTGDWQGFYLNFIPDRLDEYVMLRFSVETLKEFMRVHPDSTPAESPIARLRSLNRHLEGEPTLFLSNYHQTASGWEVDLHGFPLAWWDYEIQIFQQLEEDYFYKISYADRGVRIDCTDSLTLRNLMRIFKGEFKANNVDN